MHILRGKGGPFVYSAQPWDNRDGEDQTNNGTDLPQKVEGYALLDDAGKRRRYHGYDAAYNILQGYQDEEKICEKELPPVPSFPRPVFHSPREEVDYLMFNDDSRSEKFSTATVTETDASSLRPLRQRISRGSQDSTLCNRGWLGLYGDHEDDEWLREDESDSTVFYPGKFKLGLMLLSGLLPYLMVSRW